MSGSSSAGGAGDDLTGSGGVLLRDLLSEARAPDFQTVIVVDLDDGRLFPLTEDGMPRCLLPVANRPLLAYQLDALRKFRAVEVFIVTPPEYHERLARFLSTYVRVDQSMIIELVTAQRMHGSADALRAVHERIRGDFIVIQSDLITDVSLGALVNMHRRRTSDITLAVASPGYEEADRKGVVKQIIDDEDQEYVGTDEDGRLLMKLAALEIDGCIDITKGLLNRSRRLVLRNNMADVGVYVMAHWVLEFVMNSPKMTSIRIDVLPFLIARQFQPPSDLVSSVPGLAHRDRPLGAMDSWLTVGRDANALRQRGTFVELSEQILRNTAQLMSIPSAPSLQRSESQQQLDDSMLSASLGAASLNRDMLRIYCLCIDTNTATAAPPAASGATPMETSAGPTAQATICRRITNLQVYMNTNKDIPQILSSVPPGPASQLWERMQGFQKKEASVVGDGCELGDKVTVKQCCIAAGTKVGARSKINNCVIMEGVTVGENCTIQNTILCSGAVVENGCNINECFIGSGYTVAANAKLKSESLSASSM